MSVINSINSPVNSIAVQSPVNAPVNAPVNSIADQCHRVFIEPFKQGAYNMRDAFSGKRIETIQTVMPGGMLAPRTTREVTLSLAERATAVAIGALLLIPIVNAIAMAILRSFGSNNLYFPVRQPIQVPNVHVNNAPVNPPVNNAPVSINPPVIPIPEVPLTPEQMVARKTAASIRLAQLNAMGAGLTGNFDTNPVIMTFDLDAILNRFPATQEPSRLCDFLAWAAVSGSKQNQFRMAVEQFDGVGADQEQRTVVSDLLRRLNTYFVQRRANVAVGSAEETALKAQYKANVDKIIDANNNCIDQVLSQVQEIMLDVAGDMVIGAGGGNASFQARAGHALCNYRTDLVKEICVRQNPGEHHMADLERLVMQRLAPMLGIEGAIFNAGARFARIINDVDTKVQNAADAFLNEYAPGAYLTTQIRTDGVGPMQKLRVALNAWAVGRYAIRDEDPANPQLTDLNPRLSANFDPDAFTDFANGGEWTPTGTYLILEAAGLVAPR